MDEPMPSASPASARAWGGRAGRREVDPVDVAAAWELVDAPLQGTPTPDREVFLGDPPAASDPEATGRSQGPTSLSAGELQGQRFTDGVWTGILWMLGPFSLALWLEEVGSSSETSAWSWIPVDAPYAVPVLAAVVILIWGRRRRRSDRDFGDGLVWSARLGLGSVIGVLTIFFGMIALQELFSAWLERTP